MHDKESGRSQEKLYCVTQHRTRRLSSNVSIHTKLTVCEDAILRKYILIVQKKNISRKEDFLVIAVFLREQKVGIYVYNTNHMEKSLVQSLYAYNLFFVTFIEWGTPEIKKDKGYLLPFQVFCEEKDLTRLLFFFSL